MRSCCRPQVTYEANKSRKPQQKTSERLEEYEREISLGGTWVGLQSIKILTRSHGCWQLRAGGVSRGHYQRMLQDGKTQGAEEHKELSCLCLVSDVPVKKRKNGKQNVFWKQAFALCSVSYHTAIKMLFILLICSKQWPLSGKQPSQWVFSSVLPQLHSVLNVRNTVLDRDIHPLLYIALIDALHIFWMYYGYLQARIYKLSFVATQ